MGQVNEPLLDAFLFETKQLMEKAETILLACENNQGLDTESIHEIFRIMHTMKGSAAMMEFGSISETAHAIEDLFSYLREYHPPMASSRAGDIVLNALDDIKRWIASVENGQGIPSGSKTAKKTVDAFIKEMKGQTSPAVSETREEEKVKEASQAEANYLVWVQFDEGCEMESVRALNVRKQLEEVASVLETSPSDLKDFQQATEFIRKSGFELYLHSDLEAATLEKLIRDQTVYLKDCKVSPLFSSADLAGGKPPSETAQTAVAAIAVPLRKSAKQNYISVNVQKLDKLMDIVGELVISEVMVTRNPEISKLKIRSFIKAANQLKKMTGELQDVVMSIRMVPIGATFISMQRVVRDMSKKLGKQVELIISGEETEVDKNIIECISDPLMHLIRNSIDHGLEDGDTRVKLGKPPVGRIFLEARNEGGDVYISVRDDGRGLNREAILKKARENGLVSGDESALTDKEVWNYILAPGFSTKQDITEFSGRGVGMDVVSKNIESIRGRLAIDSVKNQGSCFTIRIPMTLAIIDGMEIAVGQACYTIPITLIREAFRPRGCRTITDSEGHEAIMLRGECIEIIRLHEAFKVASKVQKLEDGILIIVQNELKNYALFADRLMGEHQVVVKPVPKYMGKIDGVSGCSILGDGSISLILDIAGLVDRRKKEG